MKQYTGFQQLKAPTDKIYYFLMHLNEADTTQIKIKMDIKSATIQCTASEAEMNAQIKELLLSFPKFELLNGEDVQQFGMNRAANLIARNSRRGAGNTQWENVLFYTGGNSSDCPIIVAEHDGKYGVFKHPQFEKYGFVLENWGGTKFQHAKNVNSENVN